MKKSTISALPTVRSLLLRTTAVAVVVLVAMGPGLAAGSSPLSMEKEVPLLRSSLEDLDRSNFDDIDMEERFVFRDRDDLLEYIRELQRRYALLVGRPRFGRSARSVSRQDDDYFF